MSKIRKLDLPGILSDGGSKIFIIAETSGAYDHILYIIITITFYSENIKNKLTFWAKPALAKFFETLDNIAIKLFYNVWRINQPT